MCISCPRKSGTLRLGRNARSKDKLLNPENICDPPLPSPIVVTSYQGINLDDVFSGVFFSPDGDLLDISSDDDSLNLTLSSASISEGTRHPQFAQFAVLGGNEDGSTNSGGDGGGGGGGEGFGVRGEGPGMFNPARESSHQLQDLLMTGGGSSSGRVGGVVMETDEGSAAMASALGSSGEPLLAAPQVPGFPPQLPLEGAGSAQAAAAASAAAEAAAAAEQARAAQEMAMSKAEEAAKAAAAYAQVGLIDC